MDNLGSGPLLAQAIEFRKSTGCDPCLFKALAGPKTGRASLDKNHPNLSDCVTKPKRYGTAPMSESQVQVSSPSERMKIQIVEL